MFLFLYKYLLSYKLKIIILFLVSVVTLLLSLFLPYFLRIAIDHCIIPHKIKLLFIISFCYLITVLFYFIFKRKQNIVVNEISESVITDIRKDVFLKLNQASFSYYDTEKTAEIVSKAVNDLVSLEDFLNSGINIFFYDLLMLVGITIAMIINSPSLSVILFLCIPFEILTIYLFSKKIFMQAKGVRNQVGKINSNIQELVKGVKVVRSNMIQEYMYKKFKIENWKYKKRFLRLSKDTSYFMFFIIFLNNFGGIITLFIGGILLIKGFVTIGIISAFMIYITMFLTPLQNIGQYSNQISIASASVNRIKDLIAKISNFTQQIESPANGKRIRGNIQFVNVRFGYPSCSNLLNNFNLSIKAGDKIALVGETGSGKSTVLNLICRLYEVSSGGGIFVDGININTLNQTEYRSNFSVLMQETFISSGSVFENIRFGKQGISKKEIIEATRVLGIYKIIKSFPDGFDTRLRECGNILSVGQRQLIAIARIFIKNPRILIMDEATSSIDYEIEKYVAQAIDILMKGKTSIIVAHRFSNILNSDIIVYLENGKIEEMGTHCELLELGRKYYKMYNNQFQLT